MKLNIVSVLLLGGALLCGGATICFSGQTDVPTGWDTNMPSINVAEAASEAGPIFPQRVWIKRDPDRTYILIETKGLKEYLQAAKGPDLFLSLYFESDGKIGSSGKTVAGQEISGFDVSADFSTMQVRENDGGISAVLNCQVSQWDGKQFSGDITWGTRFNSSMSALASGDYASFTIPRSILDVSPKRTPARVAFALPDAKYVQGKSVIVNLQIADK
ncbi:MAG: hypothetical protein WAU78_09095 [Roseiarcus sp.]